MRTQSFLTAAALALALAGCYGGDSSPEDAGAGGVPPQDANPAPNIGQSEGFPEPGAAEQPGS